MRPVGSTGILNEGTTDTDDKFTSQEVNAPVGDEEGDNSSPGDEIHEPEQQTPLGDREEQEAHVGGDDDSPLRTADIVDRFVQQARMRLKAETIQEYTSNFNTFAERVGLEQYSRRQLAGPRGKVLIMAHIEKVAKTTWRWQNSALKAVWLYGLDLAWPIDPKRDFGQLPKPMPRENPLDSTVRAWVEAMENEPDPYLRLIWLFVSEHGWRPSHVGRLKWRNVRFDSAGMPIAIIADGFKEGFKTSAPIAARLCSEVAEALMEWKKIASDPFPENPIIPWRWANTEPQWARPQSRNSLRDHWDRQAGKWNLPRLRMCDLRHWVATRCRRAGLSKQASAYLMGHDPTRGGSMRDWYDNPALEDIFAEQAEHLPDGTLGTLDPVKLEATEGLCPESVDLLRVYLGGRMGTMEFANKIESLRLRLDAPQPPTLQP